MGRKIKSVGRSVVLREHCACEARLESKGTSLFEASKGVGFGAGPFVEESACLEVEQQLW